MNKIELPALHKDMYYFGYGIDIEKPIEMANIIIELQQENKILRENAKHNDKVVDKVNWENMLLKKENKQLQEELECTIGIVEHNRIISEKNKEIHQLKDNWIKLKEYLENKIDEYSINLEYLSAERMVQIKNKIQELEQGSDNQ